MTEQARKVFEMCDDRTVQQVFAILVAEGPYSFGILEKDLATKLRLDLPDVLKYLDRLIREGFVTHILGQVGTAGPHGHWYRLAEGVEVEINVSKK